MLWRLDGQFALDDVLPVPQKKPGRHFTSGYHVVGKASSPYEEKYANMTYGDHYRKKVMEAIEHERRRCTELLEEQKNHTSAPKAFKHPSTTPKCNAPRYNLNELRHHQRRCTALLFCARERRAHQLPILPVKWAPKRRESYYLMSERVYNDRLMMKLRDEEESPLVFDFSHTDGETDDLHDLQKLIQSTSSHLKYMKLDTKFRDYEYDFEDHKQAGNESGTDTRGENGDEGGNSEFSQVKRKVTFSDQVAHSDTDASFTLSKSKRSSQHNGDLDASDIEINCSSDGLEIDRRSRAGYDESEGTLRSQRPGDESGSGKRFSSFHSHDSSLDLLSTLRGSSRLSDDDYSSDFTGNSTEDPDTESRQRGSVDHLDWTTDFDKFSAKKLHKNPHCRHSLTRKATGDYYKKLPKLLKTSELRDKLPKEKLPQARELGHDVDHNCMEAHRTAYGRALVLARYKTLPPSYSFLAGKTSRRPFSYFAGLPGMEFKGDAKLITMGKKLPPRAEGRKAIFGDIDMNNFYAEEDELLYYINPEELKQVVASSISTDESSREDGLTTASATTSRTTTANKGLESATPSETED